MNRLNGTNGHQRSPQRRARFYDPAIDDKDGSPSEAWEKPIPLTQAPPVEAFPLEVLPLAVRSFAGCVASATNTHVDFTAVPILCAAGAAIGNSRRLRLKKGHEEAAILYVAIVAEPGQGKSAPLTTVSAPFFKTQALYSREYKKAKAAWERSPPDRRGERPAMRRCLMQDVTIDTIGPVLTNNPRGVLAAPNELSGLIGGMNQFKTNGRGNDRQKLLELWDGSFATIDRVKFDGEPRLIHRPFVSIMGTIQPDKLACLNASKHFGQLNDGFLDRFIFSYPLERPAAGYRLDSEIPNEARQDWQRVVTRLMGLKMAGKKEQPGPTFSQFTSDAGKRFEEVTDAYAADCNAPEFPRFLRGAWSKFSPGYLARLSLIIQLLRRACDETRTGDVEAVSVHHADLLVKYFKSHTRKCYQVMAADPRVAGAMKILSWLARNPGIREFSRRDAYPPLNGFFPRSEDLGSPLALLVDCHYLALVGDGQRTSGQVGRTPTPRYSVNPNWDRQDLGNPASGG